MFILDKQSVSTHHTKLRPLCGISPSTTRKDPMEGDGVEALPPDVWAKIAVFTRNTRSISRIGQVCRASRDGVTKSTKLWRALEKEHKIQPSIDPARARENVIECMKERVVKRHAIARVNRDRLHGTEYLRMHLEYALNSVNLDIDLYRDFATALLVKPATWRFRKAYLQPGIMGHDDTIMSPQMIMTSLCASYAAVCKSMAVLVLVRDDEGTRSGNDCSCVEVHIEMMLKAFTCDSADGLPAQDWIVATNWSDGENGGTEFRLRNSSTIFVCSMDGPPPLQHTFDGVVVCSPCLEVTSNYVLAPVDVTPQWMRAPDYPLPKYRVHFG